jgi:putative SOS response-associated peptidase YedK
MCGRFSRSTSVGEFSRRFDARSIDDILPSYNVAPGQSVLTARVTPDQGRHLVALKWGLVPHWAREAKIGYRMINARSETVREKPAYRGPYRRQRCLVAVDGFYEWQTVEGQKQPYYFHLMSGEPLAFAGLWDSWTNPDGEPLQTCTLLTTQGNSLISPIHDRMPVILSPEDYDLWLDPAIDDPGNLMPVFEPYPGDLMESVPVSPRVNSPKNDDPECVAPVEVR